MSQRANDRIQQLLAQLRPLLSEISRENAPGVRRAAELRFERARDEAVTLCRALPGAQVAAPQMKPAPCDAHGVTRIIELLERVSRDSAARGDDAA